MSLRSDAGVTFFILKQMLKDGNSLHLEYCVDLVEPIFSSNSFCPEKTTLYRK